MTQKLEAIKLGDRTLLVAFFMSGSEVYVDADVYLKKNDTWLCFRNVPCGSMAEAKDFFSVVAEAWGEDSDPWLAFLCDPLDSPKGAPEVFLLSGLD
jgi:hypothetical protein